MAKFRLAANAEVDMLTKGELDDSLKDSVADEWTERGRGIKALRYTSPAMASLTATQVYVIPYTPNQGYTWAIRLVGATFSSAFNLRAWITPDPSITAIPTGNNLYPLGTTGASSLSTALTFSGTQALLYGGDYVVLSASGSVTLNSYLLTVVETPTELLWKIA